MDVSTLIITTDRWNKKVINDQYKIIRKIGEGQYGKVLLSEQLNSNGRPKYVAIKTINRIDKTKFITKTYMNHTSKIKREVQIMKQCNHPNVVQLYQVIDDLKYDKILLVLEYCEYGEIEWKVYDHYSEKHQKKNGLTLNRILRDVINGLEYLHNFKGIIHRDLKPSNLLISKNKSVKISDFGVSLILEHNANDVRELGKTMGTPAFHAPELCEFVNNRLSMIQDLSRNKSKIDNRIDLWSLGVILYCLIFHELPFNGNNEFALFKNIVTKEVKFPKIKLRSRATDDDVRELELLKDLISKLLMKDPNNRISIKDIKNHDFTTFDLDLKQSHEFKKINEKIFSEQNGFTERIKRFFTKPAPPIVDDEKLSIDKIRDMERVDDLLDSYLDDSSDMASIDSVEHDIDTTNLLDELRDTPATATKLSDRIIPPPSLKLDTARNHNMNAISTASPVVSIGAGSPTSNRSLYTPTKRFSDKAKPKREEGRRTINSLTSTPDLADLEPPPVFGNGNGLSSRKNSISSTRSSGLSRITSSSSSLNLNAFLTDDNLSVKTVESEENGSESEQEADSTFILDGGYQTMSDYLDRLG